MESDRQPSPHRQRRRLPVVPNRPAEISKSDEEVLKQLPTETLSRLQRSDHETTLHQGDIVENINHHERDEGNNVDTKGKLEISVVEGSFRRIAGIREFTDDSGTFTSRKVEILRQPGESLGFYICQGDGWDRKDGVFVSRINLGSVVEMWGLLAVGDEITKVNDIDVTQMSLDQVAVIMRYVQRLFLTVKVLTPLTRSLSAAGVRYRDPDAVKRRRNPNVSTRNRRARIIPTDSAEPVPYAYTKIGQAAQNDSENLQYDTVHVYGPEEPVDGGGLRKPVEKARSTEKGVTVIDCDNVNQTVTEPYSGELKLVLHAVHNLMPPTEDDPPVCSIHCDMEPTVRAVIDISSIQEGVARLRSEYNIHLRRNHKISFTLANSLHSSTKTIPLAYFFPTAHTPRSSQEFALTTGPNGQLKFSLSYTPLLSAIPR